MGGRGSGPQFSTYGQLKKQFEKDIPRMMKKVQKEVEVEVKKEIEATTMEAGQLMQRAIDQQLSSPAEAGAANEDYYPRNAENIIASAPINVVDISSSRKWSGKRFQTLSPGYLDQIERKGKQHEIWVLIKSTKPGRVTRSVYMVNGVPMRKMKIRIRARVDRARGQKWTLWKAMEFGGTATNAALVRVKTVKKVSRRYGAEGASSGDKVSFGEEYVFMTKRPEWWKARAMDGFVEVFEGADVYWGGAAPIRTANAKLGKRLEKAVDRAIRRALGGGSK